MKFLSVFSFIVVLTVLDTVYGDLGGFFDSIQTTWNKMLEQIRKPVRIRRLRSGKRKTFHTITTTMISTMFVTEGTNITVNSTSTIKATKAPVTLNPEHFRKLQEVIRQMAENTRTSTMSPCLVKMESIEDITTIRTEKIEIPVIKEPKNAWKPYHRGHSSYSMTRKRRLISLMITSTESGLEIPITTEPIITQRLLLDWDKIRKMLSEKIKLENKKN